MKQGKVSVGINSKQEQTYVKEYAFLVKKISHNLLVKLPPGIQIDDLVQAGMIGLIEAARNFDDSKGASFMTYAGIRIRGAMLDEIRKGDWAPRSVHRNSRLLAQATRQIENQYLRDARNQEVAQHLALNLQEYHQILQDSANAKIFAIEDLGINDELFCTHSESLLSPFEKVQREDFKEKIFLEIAKLPATEKLVLHLYYQSELNLRQVGDVMGVSESRISQIHSQAIVRLKAKLTQ